MDQVTDDGTGTSIDLSVRLPGEGPFFRECISELLEIEGGHADLDGDPRGETRWGIPEGRARKHGYEGPMAELPLPKAARIYRADFWAPLAIDKVAAVDERVAFELFEAAVHVGKPRATEWLQEGLNYLNLREEAWEDIATDGIMGRETIGALRSLESRRPEAIPSLVRYLICEKGAYYGDITANTPRFETFFHGWISKRIPMPIDRLTH